MKNLVTFFGMAAVAVVASAANGVPSAPSNLTLSLNSELSVELKWNLPATYTDGEAFADGSKVSAVKVYRNNSEIAQLGGDATAYVDYMEDAGHPDGHGYGLNVYEVSACVDNVWSATCLPEQIMVGEAMVQTPLPWEPALKGLDENSFNNVWCSYDNSWTAGSDGLTFAADGVGASCGWIVGPMTGSLDLLPRRRYVAEFKVESDVNMLYSVGLVDVASPVAEQPMKFIQVISGNTLAGENSAVRQVEFVYEPKNGDDVFWPESVLFAVNACVPAGSGEFCMSLSYLKISAAESASVDDATVVSEASGIEVYNLQGVLLGSASSLDLDGYAPGLYLVRYISGDRARSIKVLVQ
ncbi:MAG: T9SS type A sorting domain-containing protein [Muribaculaceae bacterium]|nr:T9SS type A sorting domain-containing protein [Muribaculaceae bacterium]